MILPTIGFAILAICYAFLKLKAPVLTLLKDSSQAFSKHKKIKDTKNKDCPFINALKKNTLKTKKTLVFFIIFASFYFSVMTQMAYSMKDLSSKMMGAMCMRLTFL